VAPAPLYRTTQRPTTRAGSAACLPFGHRCRKSCGFHTFEGHS